MQVNFKMNKAGVSLIAVLLFMLVATIAATATWKWITSESRSSSSRMMKREAYQSAIAGIEATRAWMTYHANDVGAMIKQYQENGNAPVKIDAQFAEFKKGGQSYDVWMTGANTDGTSYKVKIVSKGSARDGKANHTEAAIFRVDGLYKVKMPGKKQVVNSDFDYSYFGASTNNAGNMNPTSMLVNGNWSGNPNNVSKNFIVTGNATLSGNNVNVGTLACIGGNLNADNGFWGKDLFVNGKSSPFVASLTGNAYFNGKVVMGTQATPGFVVSGNVSLNDTMITSQGGLTPLIEGNFCLSEKALLMSNGDGHAFTAQGNVWMPGPYNVAKVKGCGANGDHCEVDDKDDKYDRIVLAGNTSSAAYIKYALPYQDYVTLQDDRTFTQNTTWKKACKTVPTPIMTGFWQQSGYGCMPTFGPGPAGSTDGWDYWETGTHKAYEKNIANGENKYFWYYVEPGVTDVEYKTYVNTNLKTQTGVGWGVTWSNTTLGAYFAGGEVFYEVPPSNTYHDYHYSGNKILNSPYCKHENGPAKKMKPKCSVPTWFKINGQLHTSLPASPEDAGFECADKVVSACDSIWEKKAGCDGASYKVDDLLTNSYDAFKVYATKGCAAEITAWDNDVSKKMNSCYASLKAANSSDLFNGYLVVSVRSSGLKNPSDALNGKFIIIFEDDVGQQNFPPTTADSYVFLYLRNGGTGSIQPQVDGGLYNYFIFTDKTVATLLFNNSTLSGSVYARAANCAAVPDMHIKAIESNQKMYQDLILNGILCPAGSVCDGSYAEPTSSSAMAASSSSTEVTLGSTDTYYIASAPQLRVTVESQYKNDESVAGLNNSNPLSGSFIVLPRVVYLTIDPVGSLSDYYKAIPLNSKLSVTEGSVNCAGGIPTTTKFGSTPLTEGFYKCNVTGTVGINTMMVPFYVYVNGSNANAPYINFKESDVQVAKGNSTTPTIVSSAVPGQEYIVHFTYQATDGWGVAEYDEGTDCDENRECVTTIKGPGVEFPVLTVTNNSADNGSVLIHITSCDGCVVGTNRTETIYVSNSATVYRKSVEEYCSESANQTDCTNNDYGIGLPDCDYSGTWVNISTTNTVDGCKVLSANDQWSCGITGTINLEAASGAPTTCDVIIPSKTLTNLTANSTNNYLYASLKAKAFTFYYGFAGTDISENEQINVQVEDLNGNTRLGSCTYKDFDTDKSKTKCFITAYSGSLVTLSLANTTKSFNRWKCEEGADCADLTNYNGSKISFYVSGTNTVYAHFNETDKHCFFDEFSSASLACGGDAGTYCFTSCQQTGETCNANAKWKIVEGSLGNIETVADKKIRLKSSVTRKKKESEMPKVTVMSRAQAGLYGTMKAEFQILKQGVNEGDLSRMGVKNSGFLLRSDSMATKYLLLNVFLDQYNQIVARICLDGGDNCKESSLLNAGVAAYSSEGNIVMVTATIERVDGSLADSLKVSVIPSVWASQSYSTTFALNNDNLAGVESLFNRAENEHVGFRLGDPNFELYGIGWVSTDYNAECWEGYPNVKCSFRAAYAGGIVPKGKKVAPWVGLSAWYEYRSTCTEAYYYNGNDAGCIGTTKDGFKTCDDKYLFTTAGPHGSGSTIAKAGVTGCYIKDEETLWTSGLFECGTFWVGNMNPCSANIAFTKSSEEGSDEYWASSTPANLRGATLVFELNNSNHDEIEIAMYSTHESDNFSYGTDAKYSKTYKTNANGTLSLSVEDLSDVEGFDPEHVSGVYVHNLVLGTRDVVQNIQSSCPNVLALNNCRAIYNTTSKKWNISAVVYNKDAAGAVRVAVNSGVNTSNLDPASPLKCGGNEAGESACQYALNDQLVFNWDDDPYEYNMNQSYQFTISMSPKQGSATVEPCVTDPVKIQAISASCALNKNEVVVGGGIPVVTYSLNGCPDEACDYQILVGDQVIASSGTTGTGDFNNMTTNPMAMNTSDDPMAISSTDPYSVVMRPKSSNNKRAYDAVNCGSFTVKSKTEISGVSGICSIKDNSGNEVTSIGSGEWAKMHVELTANNSIQTAFKGTEYESHVFEKTWGLNNGSNDYGFQAPKAYDTYTYYVEYQGETLCSATLDVVAPGSNVTGTCALKFGNEVIESAVGGTTGIKLTPTELDGCTGNFTGKLKVGNNTLEGDVKCNCTSCWEGNSFTAPAAQSDDQTYAIKLMTEDGSHDLCSVDLTVVGTSAGSCGDDDWTTSNHETTNDNVSIEPTGGFTEGCYKLNTGRACSYAQLENTSGSGYLSINGTQFACANKNSTAITPQSVAELSVVGNCTVGKIYFSGCVDYKPVVSCSALSATKVKGSTVTLNPTVTNCNSTTPCSYTISGGGTNISHATKDWTSGSEMGTLATVNEVKEQAYTLQVANAYQGSAVCNFTINYVNAGNAPIELENGSSGVNVPCGKQIHAVGSCSGKNLIISCTGNFQKTVCSTGANASNAVRHYAGYSNGNEVDATCTTSCENNTMSCSLICDN